MDYFFAKNRKYRVAGVPCSRWVDVSYLKIWTWYNIQGQAIVECAECNCAIHNNCYDASKFSSLNCEIYCKNCEHRAVKRYNPFKLDFENDEFDESDILMSFTQRLESCKTHKVADINNCYKDLLDEHMSIFFQNIDGNKSNFDTLVVALERFSKNFL